MIFYVFFLFLFYKLRETSSTRPVSINPDENLRSTILNALRSASYSEEDINYSAGLIMDHSDENNSLF